MKPRLTPPNKETLGLLAGLVSIAILLGMDQRSPRLPPFMLGGGRLHVVVVHLPIGVLLALALVEIRCLRRPTENAIAARRLALLGAIGAEAAAVLGLLLARTGNHDPDLLSRHQWAGVGVAALACGAFSLRSGPAPIRRPRLYVATLGSCLALLTYAGHQGGALTHGSDYLSNILGGARPARPRPSAHDILAGRCFRCHGKETARAELHLDTHDGLLRGGKSGSPAVVPDDHTAGELMRRVRLPRDAKGAMPPPPRPGLSAEEILVLIDWISAGAPASAGTGL